MSDTVSNILRVLGPSLSSSLARQLESREKISRVAARKRIERAKKVGQIRALPGLTLKNNEQVLYTPEQRANPDFSRYLLKCLQDAHSGYQLPLRGIAARGGQVPAYLFPTFSAFPSEEADVLTANDVLGSLCTWNLLEKDLTQCGPSVRLSGLFSKPVISQSRMGARLTVEKLVVSALKDWLRLQGIASADKIEIRNEIGDPPQFGYYAWDLVAPSYLSSLTHYTSNGVLPGFVVADVIAGRILNAEDVEYFIAKCHSIKNKPNSRPFIAFLIADWFRKDALSLGRKNGFVFTTPKNLFGNHFAQTLNAISQLLQLKQANTQSSGLIHETLSSFVLTEHLEHTSFLLKSITFEILVGHCIGALHKTSMVTFDIAHNFQHDSINTGVMSVTANNERVELADCRMEPIIASEILGSWADKAAILFSRLKQEKRYKSSKFVFSFWTNGKITDDALALISLIQKKVPYELKLYSWHDISIVAAENLSKRVAQRLNYFFLRESSGMSMDELAKNEFDEFKNVQEEDG